MNVAAKQFAAPIVLKGREEPQNTDLEVAILGGILCDPLAYDRVCDTLLPRHFYLKYHGQCFAAIMAMRADGHPIDAMGLMARLREMDVAEGDRIVFGLIDAIPSAVNIDHHAELLVKKWRLRETIRLCREASQMAYEADATPEALRIYIQDNLTALVGDSQRAIIPIAQAMSDTLAEIQAMQDTGVMGFLPTGLTAFDEMLGGGINRGDLVIMAGRPGMGKSAIAITNILPTIAAASGQPCLVFSLEMGAQQLCKRFLARDVADPWTLQNRNVAGLDWENVGMVASQYSGLEIHVDDRPAATLERIAQASRRMKAEQGAIGAIVVDYLQIMGGMGDDDNNRSRSLGRVANGLKNLARELDTTVICLSQLNRGVESRTDKRPNNSDLRESGAIEEAADIIVMLYRDEYYNADTCDRGVAEVIITKNRNGATGTAKLLFEPMRGRFMSIDGPKASPKPREEDHDDF
jgi:replicative DNA helicase